MPSASRGGEVEEGILERSKTSRRPPPMIPTVTRSLGAVALHPSAEGGTMTGAASSPVRVPPPRRRMSRRLFSPRFSHGHLQPGPSASGSCAMRRRHFHPDLTGATAISLLLYCGPQSKLRTSGRMGIAPVAALAFPRQAASLVGSGAVYSRPPPHLLIILPPHPGISSTGGHYRPSGFHSIARPAATQMKRTRVILLYHISVQAPRDRPYIELALGPSGISLRSHSLS
jgi:hypothetical protein